MNTRSLLLEMLTLAEVLSKQSRLVLYSIVFYFILLCCAVCCIYDVYCIVYINIHDVCDYKKWRLHQCSCRCNHWGNYPSNNCNSDHSMYSSRYCCSKIAWLLCTFTFGTTGIFLMPFLVPLKTSPFSCSRDVRKCLATVSFVDCFVFVGSQRALSSHWVSFCIDKDTLCTALRRDDWSTCPKYVLHGCLVCMYMRWFPVNVED